MSKWMIPVLMICTATMSGMQVPVPGSEDLSQLVAESPVVCRGEVTEVQNKAGADALSVGIVKVERFYKGAAPSNTVQVLFRSSADPMFSGLTLTGGEHLLLFLKPSADAFTFADPYFGKLPVPRQMAAQSQDAPPLRQLERDLEAALAGSQHRDVITAILLLGNMGKISSTEPLRKLLPSGDPEIEGAVYLSLIKLGDYSTLPAVGDYFKLKSPDYRIENLRSQLARAVANIKDPSVLPVLEDFSRSENPLLRRSAVFAMRAMASSSSVPYLVERLDDTDPDVRYLSVMALATIVNKGGDWAPSRELFDQQESESLTLWKQWWDHEGKNEYPRRAADK